MDDEALRAMLPMGFGKKAARKPGPSVTREQSTKGSSSGLLDTETISYKVDANTSSPRGSVAAPSAAEHRPASRTNGQRDDATDRDDESDDSSVDFGPEPLIPDGSGRLGGRDSDLPVESQVHLFEHTKSVSALDIDTSGARVATGSYDYDIRLWDFGGMTSSFKPTKTIEPFGSYWIHDVAWSANGERLLAVSGTSQAKLFDRNGNELAIYRKGDPYIRDMKQTAGHVAELTSCSWMDDRTFVTASADSTIRLWDPEDKTRQKKVIVVRSKDRGARTKVTAHALSHDGGRTLAAACEDGTIHLWSTSGSFARSDSALEGAHEKGTITSCITFSKDGRTLATRGGDDTVKLWDLRSMKKPTASRSGLANAYSQTSVIFSADERTLLTGTSATSNQSNGAIEVLARDDLSPVDTIPVVSPPGDGSTANASSSVIRLAWHPRINQIFATTSTGCCTVFYSPTTSIRGALLCLPKRASGLSRGRSPGMEDYANSPIIVPGATDLASRGHGVSQAAKRRRMAREAASDPRVPQRPMTGPGKGGRIGAGAMRHIVQEMYGDKDDTRNEDPREALLRYADKSDEGGEEGGSRKFTKAWELTQPKTIYADDVDEEGGKDGGRGPGQGK